MTLIRKLLTTAAAAAALAFGAAAGAAFPDKPLTLVVGFSAGSSIDMVARTVASKLSQKIGQSIVVENRAGAGGNLAADYVSRSKADGYTLLVVANSIAIAPALYPDLKFDTQKDLRAVAYVGIGPVILKVSKQRGFKTLADLVSYAKAHPGVLNYGSSGIGGTPHMATVLFDEIAGISMTHIPYKGGADALSALLGGQVDVLINPLLGDAASDRVVPLAISGDKRSPLSPDVPTFGELGYPKYDLGVYYGLMAPAGVPADVVAKINAAVNETLADPAIVDALTTRSGIVLKRETPQEFQQFIDKDIALWKDVVQRNRSAIEK
ncbi:tripartite tricarboxylate transporter substrate binding protein [Achromobacter aloeverae]|uniref:Tripartite tricarboxylate transporter substrate binding protein n=1 Tax=Achromobacter aloeverae TaxID=1750518 RepID=A0A4Q1HHA7_9BURK|nr:tripartite tricarboxylate transporter substrate binding protein [Achromobacter aloeverae]RXN85957.1 tripartite tricarboxylate transporter substrate binding protein [Achromobacter aloeverae]